MGWLGKQSSDGISKLARSLDTESPGTIASRTVDELTSARLKTVLAIWQSKRPGPDQLPADEDFDILDYAVAMGNISLVSVHHDPLDFVFRVHCVNGASYIGEDMTGRSVNDYREPQYRQFVWTVFAQATENRGPHIIIEKMLMTDNRRMRWEGAVMPLQDGAGEVSSLLVGFELLN